MSWLPSLRYPNRGRRCTPGSGRSRRTLPVIGEVYESLRVSPFPGADGTGPRVIALVGSSAGEWPGFFDASGLIEQTIPCM